MGRSDVQPQIQDQQNEIEDLRRQIAVLTIKVQHLQPPSSRSDASTLKIQIPELDGCFEPEEFVDWVNEVEEIFNYYNVGEEDKVKLVKECLRGKVLNWWKQLQMARKRQEKIKVRDWKKMKKKLQEKFVPFGCIQANVQYKSFKFEEESVGVEELASDDYDVASVWFTQECNQKWIDQPIFDDYFEDELEVTLYDFPSIVETDFEVSKAAATRLDVLNIVGNVFEVSELIEYECEVPKVVRDGFEVPKTFESDFEVFKNIKTDFEDSIAEFEVVKAAERYLEGSKDDFGMVKVNETDLGVPKELESDFELSLVVDKLAKEYFEVVLQDLCSKLHSMQESSFETDFVIGREVLKEVEVLPKQIWTMQDSCYILETFTSCSWKIWWFSRILVDVLKCRMGIKVFCTVDLRRKATAEAYRDNSLSNLRTSFL